MGNLTPADIAEGALQRGTPAYNKHFPKLPEQHAPALVPGAPKQVAKAPDTAPDIPAAPPLGEDASASSAIPMAPPMQSIPLPPPMLKPSARSSAQAVAPVLPQLQIEARFELAIEQKAGGDDLNVLAIQAAREIRTRDEAQWATLMTRCTQSLAHCARTISEGKGVTWNGQRGGADTLLTREIQKVLAARPADVDAGRRNLAKVFAFVIAEQVFNEGNNRGAYFLVTMLGEFNKIGLPAQEKFMTRNKDESGFLKSKLAGQFMAMYE